jgi:beta-xylosidase
LRLIIVDFDAGIVNFDTMEEREAAFIEILKETVGHAFSNYKDIVGHECTWDDILHKIISHVNYRCLRTLAQRKLAFATYMESKRRVGTDEVKKRFEKNRHDFCKVLERRRDVGPESSWRQVQSLRFNF